MDTNSCSFTENDKRSSAVMAPPSVINVLSRSLTSRSGIATLSQELSFRQIFKVDQGSDVDFLLLKPGLDLKVLHLRKRVDIDTQGRIAIVVRHGQIDFRRNPNHLG